MEGASGAETPETTRRRLRMRSIRRGIKEMDLILTAYSGARLPAMDADALALYDRLLSENDHDLYAWISGQSAPPEPYAALVAEIAAGAQGVARPA